MSERVSEREGGRERAPEPNPPRRGRVDKDGGHRLDAFELMLAASVSKMVASTVTYPHEVVRTKMQISGSGPFRGFWSTLSYVLERDGVRGLYRGCLANLLRTTPAAAITLTTFEVIHRTIIGHGAEPERGVD